MSCSSCAGKDSCCNCPAKNWNTTSKSQRDFCNNMACPGCDKEEEMKPEDNIWHWHNLGYTVAIPTNGIVKYNGNLVMGAGVAAQAVYRFPKDDIPGHLGWLVKTTGNHVYPLWKIRLVSFPTKHHWRYPSEEWLITRSAVQLKVLYDEGHWKLPIVMPPPGCGLGGFSEAQVKPIIDRILGERVIVLWRESHA